MTIKEVIESVNQMKTEEEMREFEKKYRPDEESRKEIKRLAKSLQGIVAMLFLLDPLDAIVTVLSMGITIGQVAAGPGPNKPVEDLAFKLSPANLGVFRSVLRSTFNQEWKGEEQYVILEVLKQLKEQEEVKNV